MLDGFLELVDEVIAKDDINRDGLLTYYEFVLSNKENEPRNEGGRHAEMDPGVRAGGNACEDSARIA